MDFKYFIEYSLDNGEVSNTVGCFTYNQSKEIGRMIYDSYEAMGCKVDYLKIRGIEGNVLMGMGSKK